MDQRINGVLEQIAGRLDEYHQDPNMGSGLSTNTYDIQHEFYGYLDRCVSTLELSYGMGEEQAFIFLAGVADKMSCLGLMPPFPHDGSNDAEYARWIGAAASRNFKVYVYKEARLDSMRAKSR